MGYFWLAKGLKKTVLGFTYVVEQLSFSTFPSILTFDFELAISHLWLLGAIFGVGEGFEHCLGLLIFIFYATFNSYNWFWLDFGVISYFLGP